MYEDIEYLKVGQRGVGIADEVIAHADRGEIRPAAQVRVVPAGQTPTVQPWEVQVERVDDGWHVGDKLFRFTCYDHHECFDRAA